MYVKLKRKSININQTKKDRLLPTVGQAVNSHNQCAFTVLNFNTKGVLYGTDRKVS